MRAMGQTPEMPDVGNSVYLLEALLDMKIAVAGEYGPRSQTWGEVLAFSEATNRVKKAWERQVLFDMSWEYVQEYGKATSPFMKSPMERPK